MKLNLKVDEDSFVKAARALVVLAGTENTRADLSAKSGAWIDTQDKTFFYEGATFEITASLKSLEMVVTRKENLNPVLGIGKQGDIYRRHGEYTLIAQDIFDELKLLMTAHSKTEIDEIKDAIKQSQSCLEYIQSKEWHTNDAVIGTMHLRISEVLNSLGMALYYSSKL